MVLLSLSLYLSLSQWYIYVSNIQKWWNTYISLNVSLLMLPRSFIHCIWFQLTRTPAIVNRIAPKIQFITLISYILTCFISHLSSLIFESALIYRITIIYNYQSLWWNMFSENNCSCVSRSERESNAIMTFP